MLPSSVDCKGKSYVNDRGKKRGENGSLRNCEAGGLRANKDYKSRDDHEYRHEGETSPIA